MADLPQHAAQLAAWRDVLARTSTWGPLLEINYFTPYWAGYWVALLFQFFMPIDMAMKLVITVAFYAFIGACLLLRKAFGADRRMDWTFIPAFFGYAYAWGFLTFLFAAPLGLLLVWIALRYSDRPGLRLGLVLLVLGAGLFFSHGLVFLFANLIGSLFLLLKVRLSVRSLVAFLPYVVMALLCVLYWQLRLSLDVTPQGESITDVTAFWGLIGSRLKVFLFYPVGSPRVDWSVAPLVPLCLVLPLVFRSRLNLREPRAFVPFALLVGVWLTVPSAAIGSFGLYERFGMFFLPFYALLFRPRETDATMPSAASTPEVFRSLTAPVICVAWLCIHVSTVVAFARESRDFEKILAAAAPGSRALSLVIDPRSKAIGRPVYLNYPLWYQAERGGLVDFSFSHFYTQLVRYARHRVPPDTTSSGWGAKNFEWSRFHAKAYRYFFVRSVQPLPASYFPEGDCRPRLIESSGPWSLYENLACYEPIL